MKSTQNIKRTLFHNRASSEPKATASTAFMAKDGSPQFRNRSKTLDQKPKSLIEKPNGTVRERSKTVTLVKEDLKCVISGTTNGALNLRNIRSSESFFIHNLIPKYNFVILGLSKCGKTDLINTITTANYKNFYQIDFIESTEQNTIHILMNGEEFVLSFFEVDTKKNDLWQSVSGCGYIILYNVDSESSANDAVDVMYKVREQNRTTNNSELIILVGNKSPMSSDVHIRRCTSLEKVKTVAKQNLCKYVEISLDNGRNIDILMATIIKHVTENSTCHENFQGKIYRNGASPKVGCANFSNASKNLMNKVLTTKKISKPSKSFEDLFAIKI